MPELPEVETIKRDLIKQVLNKEICKIGILLPRAFENPLNSEINGKISDISRVGKYLVFQITDYKLQITNPQSTTPSPVLTRHAVYPPSLLSTLLIHLRMTGKLIYHPTSKGFDTYISQLKLQDNIYPPPSPPTYMGGAEMCAALNLEQYKHTRVIFYFSGGDCLLFNDIRTFGKIEVYPYGAEIEKLNKLGVDALSEDFTSKYLMDICKSKKIPIKNLLLDQRLIAGIGNIYAQEILFAARVSPLKLASDLTAKEIDLVYGFTREILELAILHNGTSISDFRRVDDKTGEFQNFLKVYGKKYCSECGEVLCKVKQGGRGTSFCGKCQGNS